jgi:hypothetical protein
MWVDLPDEVMALLKKLVAQFDAGEGPPEPDSEGEKTLRAPMVKAISAEGVEKPREEKPPEDMEEDVEHG